MLNIVNNTHSLYMFHQGFALKQFIAEGYTSANEIANILGISKAAVYGLFGAEKLDRRYVDILSKNKLKIAGITTNLDVSNISNPETGTEIGEREENNALKERYVTLLEEALALMKMENQRLREENEVLKNRKATS